MEQTEKNYHFLVIDDDPAMLTLHEIIARMNPKIISCHTSAHPEEAIPYLADCLLGLYPMPDLLLLDLNMPVMDGWEVLDALRQHPEIPIRVAVLSSSVDPEDQTRASQYPNVIGYLTKPLDHEKVIWLLKTLQQGT